MKCDETFREIIHEANILVHRQEANFYDSIHSEIFNRHEQIRILTTLKIIDKLILNNNKRALDFGAGTGNLTGKLLELGYKVLAVDISPEMCRILKIRYKNFLNSKKLIVLNLYDEDLICDENYFDLIVCYSVLHHLPDYLTTIERLSSFLKKGGIIYLDHEPSPFFWKAEPKIISQLIKYAHEHFSWLLNILTRVLIGIYGRIPSIDYSLSDFWTKKEHHIDHDKIKQTFLKKKFDFAIRVDYHLKQTWFLNPLFYIFRRICKPDTSLWIAKK
jgi:ubiquinone/menaquinone biosynthesis C-methylase UbiE